MSFLFFSMTAVFYMYVHIHTYMYVIHVFLQHTCIHHSIFPLKNATKPQNPFDLLMRTTLFYRSGENPDPIIPVHIHIRTCMYIYEYVMYDRLGHPLFSS